MYNYLIIHIITNTHEHNLNTNQTNSELKGVQLHGRPILGKFPEKIGNYELCKCMEYEV